ncbi:hypothetical protein DV735_g5247, partial [Chaetothyriales sp. CBS 134920]
MQDAASILVQKAQSGDPFLHGLAIVDKHLSADGVVAIWTANKPVDRVRVEEKMQRHGLHLGEEWTWTKITSGGEPVTALDGLWRKPYETLLLFNRSSSTAGQRCRRFIFAVPDLHSRKPCLKQLFDQILPAGYQALEIFARSVTAGWWSWGDEVLNTRSCHKGTMLSSPAKRRKTSMMTSVPVDNGDDNGNGDHDHDPDRVSRPSTPRRASYLSPTKASLARSHPHLAAQSNERRSRAQPRGGRSLIDDLLKAKNAEDSPVPSLLNPNPNPQSLPKKKSADAALPRTEPRAPLQTRQPSARYTVAQDFVQPAVVPKLAHAENDAPPHEDEPIELRNKRDEVQRLQERLRALKESTAKLGLAVNDNTLLDDLWDHEALSATLKAKIKSRASGDASFEELIATESEANKYLNLFSPGGLQLAVESSTEAKEAGHPRVIYHLTVSAPPPWPLSLFSVSLDVVTNAETAAVESILWPSKDRQAVGIATELLDWVDACLSSDLQGRNAGLLLWGIGQYFDKAVRRAKAFWRLNTRYGRGSDSGRNEATEAQQQQSGNLQQHNDQDEDGVRCKKTVEPKLMLTWNIDLSWTGVARNRCDIVPSGIPDGAVPAVKEVFARLVAVQGFQRAFDAVYDLVGRASEDNKVVMPAVAGAAVE